MSKRLYNNSYSEEIFDQAKETYQKGIRESGYNHIVEYEKPAEPRPPINVEKGKKRYVIWYNSPFIEIVKINLGQQILSLLDHHFPPNHNLRKCLNKNYVKLSYSCTNNIRQIIIFHNSKVVKSVAAPITDKPCNYRGHVSKMEKVTRNL